MRTDRCGEPFYAKQTQFTAFLGQERGFGGKTKPNKPKTKPIFAAAGRPRGCQGCRRAEVRNKANWGAKRGREVAGWVGRWVFGIFWLSGGR